MTQTVQIERPNIFVTCNDWKNENGDFRCFLLETNTDAPLKGDLICIGNAKEAISGLYIIDKRSYDFEAGRNNIKNLVCITLYLKPYILKN